MLNSTWDQNQVICSQSSCNAASCKLEIFHDWIPSLPNPSKYFYMYFHDIIGGIWGTAGCNIHHATHWELPLYFADFFFFLAPTIVWKPCQWWSNVPFVSCFFSSLLIRLKINNAYTALMLSFFERLSKLLFFSSPFSLSKKHQHWPAALHRSEMIKTALPRGACPLPCCTKTIPLVVCYTHIHWEQLLTTASALLSFVESVF